MIHRRSSTRRLAAVLTALVVATAAPLPAQQPVPTPTTPAPAQPAVDPDAPQPTFKAGVDLVRVDVTVRGARDLPVDDIQASEFEVEEDGVRQTVETVQFVRLTGTRTSDLDDPPRIRSQTHAAMEAARDDVRLFAIFLDDYHIDKEPTITLRLRKHLEDFIKTLGPNDLVAMMEPLTPLTALPFTRDRNALLAWVKQFEGRRGQVFPVKSAVEEEQLRRNDLGLVRAEVTYNALEAIVTRLGGLKEGRKSVLFVSQGPPSWDSMNRMQPLIQGVLQAANRGSVMVHTLDPRGLGSPNGGDENTMRILAGETGGRAIVNTNDPTDMLSGVLEDQSAYYLVGYAPQRTLADGKFHKISVKVKRGGMRVASRKGYWAPAEKEMTAAANAAATPEMPGLGKALDSLASGNTPAALDVWVGASRGEEGRTRLTVTWEAGRLAAPGESARASTLTLVLPAGADADPRRPLLWLPATRVTTGEEVLVPAELLATRPEGIAGAPPSGAWVTTPITNGAGAGDTAERALVHALLELVQRDANTVSFRALETGVVIDPATITDPVTRRVLDQLASAGLDAAVHLAGTELAVVVHAVAGDPGAGGPPGEVVAAPIALTAIGEAAHPDAGAAVRKAVLELAASRARRSFAFGPLARVRELHPRYLDDELAAPLGEQEPRALAAMTAWTRASAERLSAVMAPALTRRSTTALHDLPASADDAPQALLATVLGRLAGAGLDVLAARVTAELPDGSGEVHVVRAVVPGLEVETLSYGRIGERVLTRLLRRGSPLVGLGAPRTADQLPVRLTAAATERVGGPAWWDAAVAAATVGDLYPLYREPTRHAPQRLRGDDRDVPR